jgi:hypothetical protein
MKYLPHALLLSVSFALMAPTTVTKPTHITINPASGLIMPAENNVSTNWQNAGLLKIGGIPTRSTQCGSTVNSSNITPPATGDDTDVINAAIAACTANQVVILGPTTQTSAVVSISGNALTLVSGTVAVRNMIMGANIHPGTVITAGSGTSWTVSIPPYPGQTVSNQTVTVASNVFNLSITKSVLVNKGITIRGSGTCNGTILNDAICPTIVNMWDGGIPSWSVNNNNSECGVTTASPVACSSATGSFRLAPNGAFTSAWANCGRTDGGVTAVNPTTLPCGTTLTADAAQGDTSVKVTSVSNFVVGQVVMIDENPVVSTQTDPSAPASTVQASSDFLSTSSTPATMRLAGGDLPNDYGFSPNRVNEELHIITGIGSVQCPGGTSLTICFDDPLLIAFRSSGSHDARLYWPVVNGSVSNFLSQAGVENLSITRSAGNAGSVEMEFCLYCWVLGVEASGTQGSGGGAVSISNSLRAQVYSNYFHLGYNLINNGNEYPIGLSQRTTEALVCDNIDIFGGKGMVGRASSGNVICYNYIDMSSYDTIAGGIGDWFEEFGANTSHYAGSHHNLIEGNYSYNADEDNTHGNNVYIATFRNWLTGIRKDFTDITANLSVSDTSNIGWTNPGSGVVHQDNAFLRTVGPMAWNYWHWLGDNVLGTSGVTTTGNGWSLTSGSTNNTPTKVIWDSGWANLGTRSDPNLDGTNTIQFIHKNGNFDYVTNSIADNDPSYSQSFPNSLVFAGTPSFFAPGATCTYPFPWVTPQSGTKIQSNSCSGSGLPAKARWDAGTPFKQP